MHLQFNKVIYRNFLGAGNAVIEIPLDKHPSTLIVGRNGAGKSTSAEAVCFAAFGRPLRNINKPKLVNSVNGRDCYVELHFTVGTKQYVVKRGIKPNIFEIIEDGHTIPSPADSKDYQALLETNILRLNYKSFMQVVVLGNASYIPFMKLTAAARRSIIEDLLDIEVFSSMNALTKDEASTIKSASEKIQHTINMLKEQRRMAQSFTEHIEEERNNTILNLRGAVQSQENEIDVLLRSRKKIEDQIDTYDEAHEAHNKAARQRRDFESKQTQIQALEKKIRKERAFYEEHEHCPTCEQSITDAFKQDRFAALIKKEEDATKAAVQCEALIRKYQDKENAEAAKLAEVSNLERDLTRIETKLALERQRLVDLEAAIQTAMNKPAASAPSVNIEDLDDEIAKHGAEAAALSKRRVIVDAANMLLKDSGIKARIIKHYLPIINKTINSYLNAMDFPILFTLDEEFNEIILSRHRDEFEYNSFSEGEKKRIDLALLLTWRHIARLKNSASTNLLILDEVFDGSMDAAGTEEFLKIIAALERDTNVFVISHKTDQMVDKFSHTIVFEKTRGFSQVKL